MRHTLIALALLLMPAAALGQSGAFWSGGAFGRSFGGGGPIPFAAATAVGTCVDGSVMVDVNGIVRCGAETTTDPADLILRSGACYELDATCTAPDLLLAGGSDTKQYTGMTQANCATDTITVTVVDNDGVSTANPLVEGTDWDCLTDDNTCATALAAAIDALSGVSAQASTNTVGVRPDDSTLKVTLVSSDDPGCATAVNGTDGGVKIETGDLTLAASSTLSWPSAVRLTSPNDGQLTGTNAAVTTGGTLDFDDVDNRIVIKNRVGTGVGDLGFLTAGKIILDQGAGANTYMQTSAGSDIQMYIDGGLELTLDATDLTLGSGVNITMGNAEYIHNDTDGKITLGGSGGTNNEDLTIDFETFPNRATFSSSTGVSTYYFSDGGVQISGGFGYSFNGRGALSSPTDGQIRISNGAISSGGVLDGDDADNTLVVKDRAGTGAGNLGLVTGGKAIYDTDEDSDAYQYMVTATTFRTVVEGTAVWDSTSAINISNVDLRIVDTKDLAFGTGSDQLLTYTDGTGVTWNDGTNTVLTVPDDTNEFNLGTGTNLGFGNAEFIHNDTDGKITFGGSGGTNNEDLVLDFETIANEVSVSSGTGATVFDIDITTTETTNLRNSAGGAIYWSTRTELFAGADGQLRIDNAANSSGATLDVDDAADTIVVKDQAGTGAGDLALLSTGKLIFDSNEDSDTYLLSTATDEIDFYTGGTLTARLEAVGGFQLFDNRELYLGSGLDQWLTYASANTQTEWHDGTNAVLIVPDDSNRVELAAGVAVSHVVIDCDDDPYTVPAGAHYVTVETGTGTCTGNMDVVLPASNICTTTTADACPRYHITRIGAVQVDIDGNAAETINGSATYSLTSDYQTATVVETNSASTDWIVE